MDFYGSRLSMRQLFGISHANVVFMAAFCGEGDLKFSHSTITTFSYET
jgi:hypothetical protein